MRGEVLSQPDGKVPKGSPGDAADGHFVPIGPLTPGPPFYGGRQLGNLAIIAKARAAQSTHGSSSFAAAGLVVIKGSALPLLGAPLLRWGSSAAQGDGGSGDVSGFP